MGRLFELASLNLRSFSQRIARLDHFMQARFGSRFAGVVRALAPFIPPGSTVLDIGANHGKFARPLARLHGGSCAVWCFEPLEYNYTLLRRVVQGCPNVRIERLALSDRAGTADFYVPVRPSGRISPGSAHMGEPGRADSFGTSTARDVAHTVVPTERLDDWAPRRGVTQVGFIKIDVEGAEGLVFRGGRETLRRDRPPIYCELSEDRPKALGLTLEGTLAELAEIGYRPHAFAERAPRPSQTPGFTLGVRDYLLLHESDTRRAG